MTALLTLAADDPTKIAADLEGWAKALGPTGLLIVVALFTGKVVLPKLWQALKDCAEANIAARKDYLAESQANREAFRLSLDAIRDERRSAKE